MNRRTFFHKLSAAVAGCLLAVHVKLPSRSDDLDVVTYDVTFAYIPLDKRNYIPILFKRINGPDKAMAAMYDEELRKIMFKDAPPLITT